MRTSFLALVILCLSGCSGRSVLDRIETYKPPTFPAYTAGGQLVDRDTYDYRIKQGKPSPPSFRDALVCDLWQRMTTDLDIKGINQHHVSEDDVRRAIGVYVEKDWQDIAGNRPWTHSNFLKSLTTSERQELAKEVVRYMDQNGVRDR